jgi:hypothetical protein
VIRHPDINEVARLTDRERQQMSAQHLVFRMLFTGPGAFKDNAPALRRIPTIVEVGRDPTRSLNAEDSGGLKAARGQFDTNLGRPVKVGHRAEPTSAAPGYTA